MRLGLADETRPRTSILRRSNDTRHESPRDMTARAPRDERAPELETTQGSTRHTNTSPPASPGGRCRVRLGAGAGARGRAI